ncbi:hypothetical protein FVF58_47725 [Paraburkholderia panacisoli]|uniref:Uncharacterized protein n=1 Tax=Paraburkholderia panacisoli TaxID=2603818 RepID=A0A5B0G2S1_9BURK|nr:hypothetical protein [Paraburkholderia panacisoli]KAA0997724.1 hypothetical protein FVF58_47725 [Paraburkholderia panacisoli]
MDRIQLNAGKIAARQDLTTLPPPASASPTAAVGVGAIGGSGISSGVGLGAGLSFDITRLFQKHPDEPVRVYRYSVQLKDGSMREVDSVLELQPGNCVNVIDSRQAGYPKLVAASGLLICRFGVAVLL